MLSLFYFFHFPKAAHIEYPQSARQYIFSLCGIRGTHPEMSGINVKKLSMDGATILFFLYACQGKQEKGNKHFWERKKSFLSGRASL